MATWYESRKVLMAAAPTNPAVRPALRRASQPTASAVIAAYNRLGARVDHASAPKSRMGTAASQYVSGGFSQKASPAKSGTALSACQLMRQAMSASRGSSGVQYPRPNMPTHQVISNAAESHESGEGSRFKAVYFRAYQGERMAYADYTSQGAVAVIT